MFRKLLNEVWKEIEAEDYYPEKTQVFISNYGRIKKKKPDEEEFKLAKLSMNKRLLMFGIRQKHGHLDK